MVSSVCFSRCLPWKGGYFFVIAKKHLSWGEFIGRTIRWEVFYSGRHNTTGQIRGDFSQTVQPIGPRCHDIVSATQKIESRRSQQGKTAKKNTALSWERGFFRERFAPPLMRDGQHFLWILFRFPKYVQAIEQLCIYYAPPTNLKHWLWSDCRVKTGGCLHPTSSHAPGWDWVRRVHRWPRQKGMHEFGVRAALVGAQRVWRAKKCAKLMTLAL